MPGMSLPATRPQRPGRLDLAGQVFASGLALGAGPGCEAVLRAATSPLRMVLGCALQIPFGLLITYGDGIAR